MPIRPAVSASSDVARSAMPIFVCENSSEVRKVSASDVTNTISGKTPIAMLSPIWMLLVARSPIRNPRESE